MEKQVTKIEDLPPEMFEITEDRITVTEPEYCKLKVKYTADPDVVKEKVEEAVAQLRKLAIPGFRPGKAPDYAIKARAKKQINNWIATEMRNTAFDEVLYETNAKPIGQPQFANIKASQKGFSCEMTIMKKPEFELCDYKEMEVPKPHMDRDVDAQVEAMLQEIRLQYGEIEPYDEDDFVEEGDQITLDFTGTVDGKTFDGSSEEGKLYTVGSKIWPEFDNAILGMAAGEEREFDLVLPQDAEDVGGKTAHFKVLVHMGTKKKPCALNDELAEKVGFQTFDEVKERIRVVVNERIKNTEKQLVRQQVASQLVDEHDFEIPSWLALMEAQTIASSQRIDWKYVADEDREVFLEQARKNVKLSLVLDSIREKEPEAVLSDAEAIESLKAQVASNGGNAERFIADSQRMGSLVGLVASMKDEFTLQWTADNVKVTED